MLLENYRRAEQLARALDDPLALSSTLFGLAVMREYVAVLRGALAGSAAFEGKHYRAHWTLALPTRPPAPPIYLATLGPKMCELAGEIADGAILWLCPPDYVRDVAVLGQGTLNVMLAVGVSLIPTFVRLVRGDVLSVRENQYVEAARALGVWPARLALRHVLPNVVAPIIVISTVAIAWSIILGASLSFLGLGPRPPIPEWGIDLSGGRNYLLRAWWISSVPGFCIMLTVVAVNLVGDALRDELDPRLRSLAKL